MNRAPFGPVTKRESGAERNRKHDELMANLKRPDWPGRIARCVGVAVILVAAGWSPARGQPASSAIRLTLSIEQVAS